MDAHAVDRVMDELAAGMGGVDCVFANAGIRAGREFLVTAGQLENVAVSAWDRVIRINLNGVLHTLRRAVRHMKPHRKGR